MQSTGRRSRAYTNAIVSMGSTSRAVVRFVCVSCAHELELANNDPRRHGQFFAQQARRRGWDTDGHASSRVYCPDCRKTPASRPRRQVELDGVVLPALALVAEPPLLEGHAEPAVIEEAAMPRELTPVQRLQIRNLLDKHFDDKEGCYLAGDDGEPMSDQAIGVLAGVPWAEVTRIREAAYGRILVDPAIASLRAQFDDLSRAVQEQLALLERRMGEMRVALDAYGGKRVKAS